MPPPPTLASLLSRLQSHPTIRTRSQALFELRFLAQHAFPELLPASRGPPPTTLVGLSRALSAAPGLTALAELVTERTQASKPLQYILGTVPFGVGLELACRPPVLIPRPETEWWVEEVAKRWIVQHPRRRRPEQAPEEGMIKVIDLCSGSGCAGLGLLSHLDAATPAPAGSRLACVVGVDVDPLAVDLARENAVRCGYAGRAEYIEHDLLAIAHEEDELPASVARADLVLANPPYISQADLGALDRDVTAWESHVALVGGPEGSEFYPVLSRLAWRMLTARACAGEQEQEQEREQEQRVEGGVPVVAMEIGHDQGPQVREAVSEWFDGVEVWRDWSGRDRCVVATKAKVKVKETG